MTTIFTSSNGFKFDRFGAIFAAPGPHDGEQARTARLEWAQDALNPKLPTEPGVYVDKDGDNWYFAPDGERYLLEDGEWGQCTRCTEEPEDFCPFTPIEEHIEGLKK